MASKAVCLLALLALAGVASARTLKTEDKEEPKLCKYKAEEDYEPHRIKEWFPDCDLDEFLGHNKWVLERKVVKKDEECDLPCDWKHKDKGDRWKWWGEICQFKADREYTPDNFCEVFTDEDGVSLEWTVILEINIDWCADVEITVIKKGEIFDVPCHYKHHDKGHDWHWKPKPKREFKGEVCEYKIEKKVHPRRLIRKFNWDWDECIELNPWIIGREWCEIEVVIYVRCDCVEEERGREWKHRPEKKYYCDFEKPDIRRPKEWDSCWNNCCPGDWLYHEKEDYDNDWHWNPRPDYRHPELPPWLCLPPVKPDYEHPDNSLPPVHEKPDNTLPDVLVDEYNPLAGSGLEDKKAEGESFGALLGAAEGSADAIVPQGTTPEGTTPEGTTPEGTAPEGTVPEGTAPEGTENVENTEGTAGTASISSFGDLVGADVGPSDPVVSESDTTPDTVDDTQTQGEGDGSSPLRISGPSSVDPSFTPSNEGPAEPSTAQGSVIGGSDISGSSGPVPPITTFSTVSTGVACDPVVDVNCPPAI